MTERSRMLHTSGTNDGDNEAGHTAMRVFDCCSQASMAALMTAKNLVHGVIITSHAAVAGIHSLAKVVGKDSDQPLTSTQVLFAALLAYHCSPFEEEVGKSVSEFSPIIIVDALKDFEKLTGRRPDDELVQAMCEACREFVTDPAKVARMNAEKAMARTQRGQSLN